MTTNALTLAKVAQPLVDAGLTRINISLDTLDRDRFKLMTHRDRIDDVFAGIKAAQAAGINPIKINAVLLKGVNADEAPALLEWALANNLALRFIEQMPLDAGGIWERSALVTADDIYADLSTRYQLTPCDDRGSSPAEEFFVNGGPATVGIIGSVTRPFCGACDRLRLTSDGQLRSCSHLKRWICAPQCEVAQVMKILLNALEKPLQANYLDTESMIQNLFNHSDQCQLLVVKHHLQNVAIHQ
jgi:cyclic pyranopterin phosphate synthase